MSWVRNKNGNMSLGQAASEVVDRIVNAEGILGIVLEFQMGAGMAGDRFVAARCSLEVVLLDRKAADTAVGTVAVVDSSYHVLDMCGTADCMYRRVLWR